MTLHATTVEGQAGPLALVTEASGVLLRLTFLKTHGEDDDARHRTLERALVKGHGQPLKWERGAKGEPTHAAREQLEQYLQRSRREFTLPLRLEGTPFQMRVWDALQQIPYGATCGYGELAHAIGSPGAARAVGRANHENPIAIVVPCHRVVGADGRLTGFGGGLGPKQALLDLERGQAALAGDLFSG